MLPTSNKYIKQKLLLGVTHLFQTGGIGVATYAGSASATQPGGVMNQKLNIIGNLIMLFVLFAIIAWMYPTYRKIQRYQKLGHPNASPARWMLAAVAAAMPFWLVRMAWLCTYALDALPALDVTMGVFSVKLLLSFGTYFFASIIVLAGGWFGVRKGDAGTVEEYGEDELGRFVSDVSNVSRIELEAQRKH